eukprot:TRINITY_DN23461_c0_g1_i1.p1 TRINITY_DN23461_c0_g1~~TRINITY_DN23461_c0_g1_i1.p1  ORF type:complete len:139 (+),score=23.15 TRINITY_DN23461_c0_g1_i1:311-727(+)
MIYSLYIINRSGGLIYVRDFNPGEEGKRVGGNDTLRLGSTFHGLHAISSQLSPVATAVTAGIEVLETTTFKLESFQTETGTKFFAVATPGASLTSFLRGCYEHYTDYALKSPFYELEMPIRCELFDIALDKLNSDSKV